MNNSNGSGWIIFVLGWIIWAGMNGAVAVEKGRKGAGAFFSSLFLSPAFVYLYLLAVPALKKKPAPKRSAKVSAAEILVIFLLGVAVLVFGILVIPKLF